MLNDELAAAVKAAAQPGDVPVLYRAIAQHGTVDIRIDGTEPISWLAAASYINEVNGFGMDLFVYYDNVNGGERSHLLASLPQDPIYDAGL